MNAATGYEQSCRIDIIWLLASACVLQLVHVHDFLLNGSIVLMCRKALERSIHILLNTYVCLQAHTRLRNANAYFAKHNRLEQSACVLFQLLADAKRNLQHLL